MIRLLSEIIKHEAGYIDPGIGGLLVQTLLAGFFSLVFAIKRVRMKIVKVVKKVFGRKNAK